MESPPWATHAGTFDAEQTRRAVFSAYARTAANSPGIISGGLISSTDMQLSAAVSGLVVNISTGECIVGGTEGGAQGGYYARNASTSSVSLATANPSNPRVDLICATVADAAYTLPAGGTSGSVTIQAVTGTPTPGANLINLSGAALLPASSLLLGYVLVPNGATSLTSVDIANEAGVVSIGVGLPTVRGQILGSISYNGSTSGAYTPNGSALTALDTTHLRIPITVPASGVVRARASGTIETQTSTGTLYLGFMNGATVLESGVAIALTGTGTQYVRAGFEAKFALSPGASVNVDLAAWSAASMFINYGPSGSGANIGPIDFVVLADA